MKKVLLVISMILASIATAGIAFVAIVFMFINQIFSGIINGQSDYRGDFGPLAGFFFVIGVIVAAIAVLNVVAIVKIGGAVSGKHSGQQVVGWGAYLLFTTGFIAGVLALVGLSMQDDKQATVTGSSIEQELKSLDAVFDKGLISKEEYQQRRHQIITKL